MGELEERAPSLARSHKPMASQTQPYVFRWLGFSPLVRLRHADGRARDALAVFTLAALTVVFYWNVLRGTQSVLAFPDNSIQSVPWYTFAAHWLSRGVLPLWDPNQF